MVNRKRILKWALPVTGILIVAVLFGYLRLFTWNPERQAIAVIGSRKITVAQFNREMAKVPAPYQDILREDPMQLLDQLIIKELLVQEAKRQGLKSSGPGDEADFLIPALLKKEVFDKVKVSQDEVEGIYRQHREQLGGKSMTEVAPLIEGAMREAKGRDQVEDYITGLKSKANVQVDEKRLKKVALPSAPTNTSEEFKKAIASGMPVLVDFGSNTCVPCRMIRPILKEIGQEYAGKAHILVIDVYKYQELANQYGVQVIPTLVFFDKSGKEVSRHLGAWDKPSIIDKLKEAGLT